jgi:hypothetical protein
MPVKHVLLVFAFLAVAGCTSAGPDKSIQPTAKALGAGSPDQADDGDCIAELYAYTSVLTLARKMGSDRDVYDDALGDLRDQLVDCLTNPPPDFYQVHQRGNQTTAQRPL